MKKLALVLAIAMLLITVAAPATLGEEQITLRLLAPVWQEYVANLERLAELYEEEHPNVSIEVSVDGGTLTPNLAAGNYPDLFVFDPFGGLETYKEYLGELTGDEVILSNIDPDTLPAGTFDDKLYGVAITTESDGLVYNKAVLRDAGFEEPPHTLSEMTELCEKLTENGVTPFALGFAESWIVKNFLLYAFAGPEDLQTASNKVISGEVKMADIEFCKDFEAYIQLMLANCNDKIFETDYTTMLAMVATGQAAMCTNGSWVAGMLKELNPDVEMGIMGHPYTDDPNDYKVNITPSSCMCYFKDAAHPEASKEFIEWFVSSESAKTWLGSDFGVLSNVEGVTGDYDGLVLDTIAALEAGENKLWGGTYFKNFDPELLYASFQKYVMGDFTWDEMWNAVGDSIVANNAA